MSQTVSTDRAARAHVRIPDDWMNTLAASRRARVSKACIIRWADSGLVSGRKVVGRWWIDARDLDRLLTGEAAPAE
jgi:hypothetical protein